MSEIKLGDKVRDKYSGFTGIAIAKTEYINGCIQYSVIPKVDKKNEETMAVDIDEGSLEIITPVKKEPEKIGGGKSRPSIRQRGY